MTAVTTVTDLELPVSPATRTVATTDSVVQADRVAFWEDYNAQRLVGLRCSTFHDEGLHARETNLDLDGVALAHITANAHVIERGHRHVDRSPKEAVFITHLLAGSAFFVHAEGCLRVTAGDTIVYDASRPYMFGFESAMRQALLDVPHALVPDGVLEAGAWRNGAAVKVGGPRASTLVRLMKETLRADAGELGDDPARDARILPAALALIAPQTARADALVRAAQEDIQARLADPRLDADSVARRIGISTRHLNRLCSTQETSVTRLIQQERLRAARRDLTDARYVDLRIADIAARWGFSSQAQLSRACRAAYGATPTEIRTAALIAKTGH